MRSGNRNAHGHLTSAILRENCQEKCRGLRLRQPQYPDFVQACRVDMDMDISLTRTTLCKRLCMSLRNRNAHKHFTRAIICENWKEKPRWSTLIEPRPLTPTVRTPQCGHTAWGKTCFILLCSFPGVSPTGPESLSQEHYKGRKCGFEVGE